VRSSVGAHSQPGGPDDVVFTLREAQNFLRLGRSKFFDLLRHGQIPIIRQGTRRRYCWRSDLVAYLNTNRVEVSGDALVGVLSEIEAATMAREHSVKSGDAA
jgi:Helix-turn-helix domain